VHISSARTIEPPSQSLRNPDCFLLVLKPSAPVGPPSLLRPDLAIDATQQHSTSLPEDPEGGTFSPPQAASYSGHSPITYNSLFPPSESSD